MARRKATPSKPKQLPNRKRKTLSGVFESTTVKSSDPPLSIDDEWTRLADEAEPAWFVATG